MVAGGGWGPKPSQGLTEPGEASGEPRQLGEHDAFPIPLCGLLPPYPLMLVLGLACCMSMLRCGWCLRRLRFSRPASRLTMCVFLGPTGRELGVCLERQPELCVGKCFAQ